MIQILGVERFSFSVLLTISIIITIMLSYLSIVLIEKPAERLKKKVLQKLVQT